MDKWTWLNEVVQNLVALAVVGVWLYLVAVVKEVPVSVDLVLGAVLLFLGFQGYQRTKNGGGK